MHDPAMMEFTQIATIISIVFLLWSANIWIFGVKHSRQLTLRNAAICVAAPGRDLSSSIPSIAWQ